jgi:hypothetical protein
MIHSTMLFSLLLGYAAASLPEVCEARAPELVDGKKHGQEWVCSETGAWKSAGQWVEGAKEGKWTLWHANGVKSQQGNYVQGKREGLWFGWYDDGNKASKATFEEDLKEGTWTKWHKNGEKAEEGTYVADQKEGAWKEWYESGSRRVEGTYKNDKQEPGWASFEDVAPKKVKVEAPENKKGVFMPGHPDADAYGFVLEPKSSVFVPLKNKIYLRYSDSPAEARKPMQHLVMHKNDAQFIITLLYFTDTDVLRNMFTCAPQAMVLVEKVIEEKKKRLAQNAGCTALACVGIVTLAMLGGKSVAPTGDLETYDALGVDELLKAMTIHNEAPACQVASFNPSTGELATKERLTNKAKRAERILLTYEGGGDEGAGGLFSERDDGKLLAVHNGKKRELQKRNLEDLIDVVSCVPAARTMALYTPARPTLSTLMSVEKMKAATAEGAVKYSQPARLFDAVNIYNDHYESTPACHEGPSPAAKD